MATGSATARLSEPSDATAAWDEWHTERDALERRHALPEVAIWRELALRHVGNVQGQSVLDCGSARGGFSRILAERGAFVSAVDASAVAVDLTRRQLQSLGETMQADARRLPFDDDRFDAAVCLQTLNYVRPPEVVVSELVRVVKPGGVVIATTLNPWSALGASRAVLGRLGRAEYAPGEVGISPWRLVRLLRDAGLEIDAVEGAGHAVVVPGVTTLPLPWLRFVPRSERIAFHVCVAGRLPIAADAASTRV